MKVKSSPETVITKSLSVSPSILKEGSVVLFVKVSVSPLEPVICKLPVIVALPVCVPSHSPVTPVKLLPSPVNDVAVTLFGKVAFCDADIERPKVPFVNTLNGFVPDFNISASVLKVISPAKVADLSWFNVKAIPTPLVNSKLAWLPVAVFLI